MSGAVIIALASARSSQVASQSKVNMCKYLTSNFDSKHSTVAEQKEYAECVMLLNPAATTGGEIIFLKMLVASILIGSVIGTYLGFRGSPRQEKWMMACLGCLLGAMTPPIVMAALLGVYKGIIFIFS